MTSRSPIQARALAAAAGIGVILGASGATAVAQVKVLPSPDPRLKSAKVRPAAVEWLMTGDYMTKLRWRHWGRRHTTARGTYYLNRCDPTCGGGPYSRMKGKLTLSRLVTCHGARLYTAATASYYTHGHWHKAEALGQPPSPCEE